MEIQFENRDAFKVFGFKVETNPESDCEDIEKLLENHEKDLLALAKGKSPLYGIMWDMEKPNYSYLLAIEDIDNFTKDNSNKKFKDAISIEIPKGFYAVGKISQNTNLIEAWKQLFENDIPNLAYLFDDNHGKYFECYSKNAECTLWVPVKKTE